MATLETYKGSIELVSGITPKNGNTFPLVEARDVQVDDEGRRLDEVVDDLDTVVTVELSVESDAITLKAGRGVTHFYEKTVNDANYILALFSEDIRSYLIGARGVDITEYTSGGTLSIGGDIREDTIEFLPYVGTYPIPIV